MCRSVIDNTRSAKLDISVQNHKSVTSVQHQKSDAGVRNQ